MRWQRIVAIPERRRNGAATGTRAVRSAVTACGTWGTLALSMSGRREALRLLLVSAVFFAGARMAIHVATFALPLSNDDAIPMIQAALLLRGEATTTLINQPYNGT